MYQALLPFSCNVEEAGSDLLCQAGSTGLVVVGSEDCQMPTLSHNLVTVYTCVLRAENTWGNEHNWYEERA